MVVGGLFNAFAFAGAGFLFSKLNHSGYKDEIKRHNLALEHLSKAKQEWYEEEVSRKNKIEEKIYLTLSNTDFIILPVFFLLEILPGFLPTNLAAE